MSSYVFVGKPERELEEDSQLICAKHEEIAALIDSLSENVYSFKPTISSTCFIWKQDKTTRWEVIYDAGIYRNSKFKLTLLKKKRFLWCFGFWTQYPVPDIYLQNFKTAFIKAVENETEFRRIQANIEGNRNLLKAIKG